MLAFKYVAHTDKDLLCCLVPLAAGLSVDNDNGRAAAKGLAYLCFRNL